MTKPLSATVPATTHRIRPANASDLSLLSAESVDLVVTSPPYPMIAMWDDHFFKTDKAVGTALETGKGEEAWRLMHGVLEPVWNELLRVTKPGAFLCVNVGDAVRTVGSVFRLYPNHSQLEHYFSARGADVLPRIIWRKTTNAPNKFMGSGVLPAGAYVTLEHEYILIFRKKGKRLFSAPEEKMRRKKSAIFWEERNAWYSDLWELPGVRQDRSSPGRQRSGAFPFELAYRLIGMYSLRGDTVLDPFLGTGTTAHAAAALGRNSIGFEIDESFVTMIEKDFVKRIPSLAVYNRERLQRHHEFVRRHVDDGKTLLHRNIRYGFPVKMRQETELVIPIPDRCTRRSDGAFLVEYTA